MNISGGKDVLKFFSKNKKDVSESQGFSSEEIAHGVFRVEKKFSATALSYGFPRLDMEGVMPYS